MSDALVQQTPHNTQQFFWNKLTYYGRRGRWRGWGVSYGAYNQESVRYANCAGVVINGVTSSELCPICALVAHTNTHVERSKYHPQLTVCRHTITPCKFVIVRKGTPSMRTSDSELPLFGSKRYVVDCEAVNTKYEMCYSYLLSKFEAECVRAFPHPSEKSSGSVL